MKTKQMITGIFLLCSVGVISAQKIHCKLTTKLPSNIKIDKSKPVAYHMVTDYYDYDLQANFIRKARVAGDVTCHLVNDSVRWNNVYISEMTNLSEPFTKGQQQLAFENFTYKQNQDVLAEETFAGIPQIDFRLKNLVFDVLGFEVFAYAYWDSLALNKKFCNHNLNDEVQMGEDGTFENKEITLTWIGITEIKGETCAIIKYSQMNGKVSLNLENVTMKGRSHYWGEVYVSLSDKQIEYATLSEDVVIDVFIKGQKDNFLGYTVRKIEFTKAK